MTQTGRRKQKHGNQGQRTDKDVPEVLRGLREETHPVMDLDTMSSEEKILFREMMLKSVEAMNNQVPLQQVKNMKHWFRSSLQSALYIAGCTVTEYRALNEDLKSLDS